MVSEDDTVAVGDAGDVVAVVVAEAVADAVVGLAFGGAVPFVAFVVAEADEVSIARAGHHVVVGVEEAVEAPRSPRSVATAAIDHGV